MGAETDLILRTAPLIMLVALLTGTVGAFSISPPCTPGATAFPTTAQSRSNIKTLQMASSDENDEPQSQDDKLAALGYSSTEISRSKGTGDDATSRPGEQDVVVEEFEVDAATLTAVGFGLIAFNFFVLANLGDGGIGGVVASIINSSRY